MGYPKPLQTEPASMNRQAWIQRNVGLDGQYCTHIHVHIYLYISDASFTTKFIKTDTID